jgi:diguanylate cyclase (GGDEF)-like protein/PAS domain S-box-containing protein
MNHSPPEKAGLFWLPPNHRAAMRNRLVIVGLLAIGVLLAWALPPLPGVRGIAGYLPLHTLLETIAIVIAMLVFAVGWNAYSEKIPGNIVLLSCAFFGVGILDFTHQMSYTGMPDFITPGSPDKSISFWLSARTLATAALLVAAIIPWRPFASALTRYVLLASVCILVFAIHWLYLFHDELMPVTFVQGKGLTPFKVYYEYVLITINLMTAFVLWMGMRKSISINVFGLFAAVCVMAMSEFFFTLYAVTTDIFNVLGHIYKVIAYLFIYHAIFVAEVRSPYRQLKASQDQLQATLDALPDLLFELDVDGRFVDYHNAYPGLLAMPAEEFLGKTVSEIMPAEAALTCMAALREAQQYGHSQGKQIELIVPVGKRWFELSVSPKVVEEGQKPRFIVLSRDVTERKTAEVQIHKLAYYDALTHLPNRLQLEDRLMQSFSISARNGQFGAVLFFDLDQFKKINETKGYEIGDMLLIEVAKRLESKIHDGDTVARIGSDEFVVILEELGRDAKESAAEANWFGEELQSALSQPYQLKSHIHHLTPSIGIAMFKGQDDSFENLLKHAEVAMQQVKTSGRNAIRFHDQGMQAELEARAELEIELRQALDKQQFQLYYQIQVDSLNRALGAEALIRWIHPERGMISPAQFIPLSEEMGLILPIGAWVLITACVQLRVWQQNPLTRELVLAVNVSAKQFHQSDFVSQVQRALLESGAKASMLKLELTESMMLDRVDDTIAKMRELKLLGVHFSMDDFGTGYSSLQYIKRLPLDQLKIDQSFVRDISSDVNDAAIVQAIIAMSDALGLSVIAEGVETEAQREFLDKRGCHAFQGYLFSKPVPVEQFEVLLRKNA